MPCARYLPSTKRHSSLGTKVRNNIGVDTSGSGKCLSRNTHHREGGKKRRGEEREGTKGFSLGLDLARVVL
jgi:hypothetical protein